VQFVTFVGPCVRSLGLIAPAVAVLCPPFLAPLGSGLLYNHGVTAPVLLGLGMWVRTPLQLGQSTVFNPQGTSTYHFRAVLPVMGLPIGLVVGVGLSTTLYVAAGLGALGLATAPLWTRGIGGMLRAQRHAMATGFHDE
jgi:hypothetical protein